MGDHQKLGARELATIIHIISPQLICDKSWDFFDEDQFFVPTLDWSPNHERDLLPRTNRMCVGDAAA
jgi:hypothetical protein